VAWQHQYWTGYFTSRASLKRFERQARSVSQPAHHKPGHKARSPCGAPAPPLNRSGYLQASRQLEALAALTSGQKAGSQLGER
jgi:hypothetical protein